MLIYSTARKHVNVQIMLLDIRQTDNQMDLARSDNPAISDPWAAAAAAWVTDWGQRRDNLHTIDQLKPITFFCFKQHAIRIRCSIVSTQ